MMLQHGRRVTVRWHRPCRIPARPAPGAPQSLTCLRLTWLRLTWVRLTWVPLNALP